MELVEGKWYKWKYQDEVLIYVGKWNNWHQFALVENPDQVWCEVLESDLHLMEGVL